MKKRLLTQAINQVATVKSGKVPIVRIKSKDGHEEAVMAINFLRAGCPEVQLVVDNGHEVVFGAYTKMKELMLRLQLPKERFWLLGKPKIEKGGSEILVFKYHPSSK